jgi:hypothetical protein
MNELSVTKTEDGIVLRQGDGEIILTAEQVPLAVEWMRAECRPAGMLQLTSTPSPTAPRARARLRAESKGPAEAIIPNEQPEPIASRMIAVNSLKCRQPGTAWTAKEFAAFKAAGLDRISDEEFSAQIEPMFAYYDASVSSLQSMWRSADPTADFRRRELLTLLNEFPGEADKARAWVSFRDAARAARDAGRV